ncbi:unnamed protein product [Arabidopsis lyrata]|nr:unnamed protein product [Arabidopsis lyrata]
MRYSKKTESNGNVIGPPAVRPNSSSEDPQELLENRVVQVTYGKSKADFINRVNHETALLHSR